MIQHFTDLDAWKSAHALTVRIYLVTKTFPKEEIFGLVSQIRRAAVSVTSNIAEGFPRASYKEKVQSYSVALASLSEVQSQLFVARDVEYLPLGTFQELFKLSEEVSRILCGLIKGAKSRA